MTTSTTAIDLSQLPEPTIVEQIDYETILADALEDYYDRMDATGVEYTKLRESDPAYKLAEVFAYREMLVRQRANDSAKAVLLAYATGSDLDHKAAEKNLTRRLISEATETSDAVYETDASLRKRVQLAPEGYTTAGSEGSYLFHGMNADSRVKDIQPFSPTEGVVSIYVLSTEGDGTASETVLSNVSAALNQKEIRPLTDHVNVYSASIINYSVEAILDTGSGPDSDTILAAAAVALSKYTKEVHALNQKATISGIYKALQQDGVIDVDLIQPTQNIVASLGQAPYCNSVNISLKEDHDE
ncbi:MAG: baseplate J family protein [Acinetobacter sp.]|uniref:baseplate assembly protein n=1 Tax=Acinetobacter TaxID=469 RepID=UPI000DB67162|nr:MULTISPECIES: baseplate J/gp47 family protein [Acinetobacter]MDS9865974.1 baseplate J family protein [Acinetobacter pittii]PZT89814.1 MAG: baseplate J family protein [Acinetobacter sp.]